MYPWEKALKKDYAEVYSLSSRKQNKEGETTKRNNDYWVISTYWKYNRSLSLIWSMFKAVTEKTLHQWLWHMQPFCTVVRDLAFALCSPPHPRNPHAPFGTPSVTFGLRQRPPAVQWFALGLMFWNCDATYKTAEKFKPEKTESIHSSILKQKKGNNKKQSMPKTDSGVLRVFRSRMLWFPAVLQMSVRLRSRFGIRLGFFF